MIAVMIADASAIKHTKIVNMMRIAISTFGLGAQAMLCGC